MATIPHQNDVLFGKGTIINDHPGNQRFRSIVDAHKHKHKQKQKLAQVARKKRLIAIDIMNEIRNLQPSGRFLMEGSVGLAAEKRSDDDLGKGIHPSILKKVWVFVEDKKAIAKVVHRLREKDKGGSGDRKGQGRLEEENTTKQHSPDVKQSENNCGTDTTSLHEKKKGESASDFQKQPGHHNDVKQCPSNIEIRSANAKANQMSEGLAENTIPILNECGKRIPSDELDSLLNHDGGRCLKEQRAEETCYDITTTSSATTLGATSSGQSVQPELEIDIHQLSGDDPKAMTNIQKLGSLNEELHSFLNDFESHLDHDKATPISIRDWTAIANESSSKDEYIESSVNLACVLAKQLHDLGAAGEMKLNDITAKNVTIYVKQVSTPLNDAPQHHSWIIKDVKFLSSDNNVTAAADVPADNIAADTLHPSSVCSSLGNILLEIFSKCQSQTIQLSRGTANHLERADDGEDDTTMPSVAKRMASVSISDSISATAKSFLLGLGTPLSICRLVCDLLDATNETPSNSTLISLDQVLWDLTNMKNNPQTFLFDRTCPQKALDDTCLFNSKDGYLFGREKEMEALMAAKNRISRHVHSPAQSSSDSIQEGNFRGEATFLAGYAGSGKSCLLHSLVRACHEEQWFVLKCKFDKQAAPLKIMAKAFDDFFGLWGPSNENTHSHLDPSMMESFRQVCDTIFTTIDGEGYSQLCDLIPNFSRIFPLATSLARDQGSSSNNTVGSAEKRRVYLFHLLFKSICSTGRPVLVAFDDLQWSDSLVTGCISDFLVNYIQGEEACRQGFLVAGTFRSNEVKEGDGLLENINFIKHSGKANVTMVDVGELGEKDVNQLISTKLGLPTRYTLELARLVRHKTRGNPFFVDQFFKSIIHNNMLQFSVRFRRWKWDCETIDFQMISDGVAKLLTSTFNLLPVPLMESLKVVSCFGNQIDDTTIELINSGHQVLPFDMQNELPLAVKEGILEKAGPIYAFAHDLIHQAIYDIIPAGIRQLLHKNIGTRLLKSASNNQTIHLLQVDQIETIHLLAVDQINLFLKDGNPSPEERSQFVRANVAAAKFAIAASSFEQARSYIDTGMKLLDTDHWEKQYSLSLDLFEMSASLCYMNGDINNMSSCLDEILSHSKSFEDSLNSSAMLVKLLSSSSKYDEAMTNCLVILSQLGEEFLPHDNLSIGLTTLSALQPILANITKDQIKSLPAMADTTKLQAMKFLSMLCGVSGRCAPTLLPLLSCRMMKLTLDHGFCHDSIIGLVITALSLFLFTGDLQLAYRVGKVGEMLREESPNRHSLRSRLCHIWDGGLKIMVEPAQAIVAIYPSLYESAMLVGDAEGAMHCRQAFCTILLYIVGDLWSLPKHLVMCTQQSAKYHEHLALHISMALHHALICLSGKGNVTEIKSYVELNEIGEQSNNAILLCHVVMSQIFSSFWFRDYFAVVKLCENHPCPNYNRPLDVFRIFYEGIASLNIARKKQPPRLRIIGEDAVKKMSNLALVNEWNFSNKSQLLKAELHYLNRDYKSAEDEYKASITSAREHKFIHEEALVNELYGIFCIENMRADKGIEQLHIAVDKYKQWGAMKKADDLQLFIDVEISKKHVDRDRSQKAR